MDYSLCLHLVDYHLYCYIIRRREGYEFMVGPPKVINKEVDGKKLEPYEVPFLYFYGLF